MARNVFIINHFQTKIDTIVHEMPKLFRRLNIIMDARAIWNLLNNENPTLGKIGRLIVGDTSQISPTLRGNHISNEMVNTKREELTKLNNEVIILFQRLQTVLNWSAVVDLCFQRSQIVVRPQDEQDEITILGIYTDYVEAAIDERQIEQRRREIESSSSSDGSCNLHIW